MLDLLVEGCLLLRISGLCLERLDFVGDAYEALDTRSGDGSRGVVDSWWSTGTAARGDNLRRLAAEVSMVYFARVDYFIAFALSPPADYSWIDAFNRDRNPVTARC